MKERRMIRQEEIEFISAALRIAATEKISEELQAKLPNLRVHQRCDCGCPSVNFERPQKAKPRVIADGIATSVGGHDVGFIIWGTSDTISGLEVYEMGAPIKELPSITTLRGWGPKRPGEEVQ